jgi:hypothetical protein
VAEHAGVEKPLILVGGAGGAAEDSAAEDNATTESAGITNASTHKWLI